MLEKPLSSAAERPSMVIALVVACALVMENLDSTIINTSVPEIARSLGESPVRLNVAITSYLLSLAVFTPVSGWVADRFGTRTVFCAAILVFTASSALCGLSDSLGMMVATRVLQGIGGSMMTPVGRLILARTFPKESLVTAISYMTLPATIGPAMGPMVGGFLTTYASWRWVFFINIPVGLVGIALSLRFIEDVRLPATARFDFLGFVVAGLALGLVELFIEFVGRGLIPVPAQAALLLLATLAALAYHRHARRLDEPVLDLKLFRLPTFHATVVTGGLGRIAMGAAPFLLPLLFQVGFGLTAVESGSLSFATGVGALLLKLVASRIFRAVGFRRLLAANSVVIAALLAGMALFRQDTPHAAILGYLLAFGFLSSLQYTAMNALSYAELTPTTMGRGTSITSVAQRLCMSFGVGLSATTLALLAGPKPSVGDLHQVFLVVAVLPLLGVPGFLRLAESDGDQLSGRKATA